MNSLKAPQGSKMYWYCGAGVIEKWFLGVFEGGGAKGVAYIGALRAMECKKCWFSGVAGSSAGAITAALVASGLSAADVATATNQAVSHLQTGFWSGIRRLHTHTGYYPSGGLHMWLEDLLRKQVGRGPATRRDAGVTFRSIRKRLVKLFDGQEPDASPDHKVTFSELYAATGIELNVIAADLSLRRQIVLSHYDTPECAVADAVVASCSIPFAFQSWLLQANDPTDGKVYHHTIVDGGVWSNFPMFVFEDVAFRRHYEREPQRIDTNHVIGFVLKEKDPHPRIQGDDVKFLESIEDKEFRAREWLVPDEPMDEKPYGKGARLAAGILWPFSLVGRLLEPGSRMERGRWPAPRAPRLAWVRYLVQTINGWLNAIHLPVLSVVALAVVGVGAFQVISYSIEAPIVRFLFGWIGILLAVGVSALTVFVAFVGLLTNFALLRAARRILYGLVSTFVHGPGAPEWAAEKGNIIELTIPPNVETLRFEMGEPERTELIDGAYKETLAKITDLCGRAEQAVDMP